jgi:hypothetical protein
MIYSFLVSASTIDSVVLRIFDPILEFLPSLCRILSWSSPPLTSLLLSIISLLFLFFEFAFELTDPAVFFFCRAFAAASLSASLSLADSLSSEFLSLAYIK